MNIDLTVINFTGEEAASYRVRYARTDNTSVPTYNIAGNPTAAQFPYSVPNIPNGAYSVGVTPVYADGRVCNETFRTQGNCLGIGAFNAVQSGSNFSITYTADDSIPQVYLTVNYPNGGSFQQAYTNGSNGSTILVPIPSNIYGNYTFYMQSICDPDTGYYSPQTPPVSVAINQNTEDSFNQISNTGTVGATRTQIFQTGTTVTPGVTYYLTVYSHEVNTIAVVGDTPASIISKLVLAINNTTETQWNSSGSAPAHGTTGFPPTATASGNQITLILNYANQFAGGVRS